MDPLMDPLLERFSDPHDEDSSAFAQLVTNASLQALLAYQLLAVASSAPPDKGLRTEAEISSRLVAGLLAGSGYLSVEALGPDPRPLSESELLQELRAQPGE